MALFRLLILSIAFGNVPGVLLAAAQPAKNESYLASLRAALQAQREAESAADKALVDAKDLEKDNPIAAAQQRKQQGEQLTKLITQRVTPAQQRALASLTNWSKRDVQALLWKIEAPALEDGTPSSATLRFAVLERGDWQQQAGKGPVAKTLSEGLGEAAWGAVRLAGLSKPQRTAASPRPVDPLRKLTAEELLAAAQGRTAAGAASKEPRWSDATVAGFEKLAADYGALVLFDVRVSLATKPMLEAAQKLRVGDIVSMRVAAAPQTVWFVPFMPGQLDAGVWYFEGRGSTLGVSSFAGVSCVPVTTFMGVEAAAGRVVYIVDISGSMDGAKMGFLKEELTRSINKLEDGTSFLVLPFSSDVQVLGSTRYQVASAGTKKSVGNLISRLKAEGGTEPLPAFEIAFRQNPRPEAIYFMTDGLFDDSLIEAVEKMQTGRNVPIHCISLVDRSSEALMERIAKMSDGSYVHRDRFAAPVPSPARK
ncbi:MAG TPA: VWA domain-containing protein [Phycisphaerales bacterium]|nr:VWA domain-containing protein [Phycisphaerales bacterium]